VTSEIATDVTELEGGTVVVVRAMLIRDLPCVGVDGGELDRATPARRRAFASGRACAREALAALGVGSVALPPDANGVPRWPSGFTGSISHNDAVCCATAARTADVVALGVDVERIVPFESALVRRVCRTDERARIARMPDLDGLWPNIVFSAKEAVYKCLSPRFGCFLEFEDVALDFTIQSGSESGGFRVMNIVPGPWEGAARGLVGRWLIAGGHIFAIAEDRGVGNAV
jgi:4'-phosphopantetheinyl transferase EntD